MSSRSLAVCIAPSLLENPNESTLNGTSTDTSTTTAAIGSAAHVLAVTADAVDAAKKIPELTIFLIDNASELIEGFEDESPPTSIVSSSSQHRRLHASSHSSTTTPLHQSTDSGLSDGALATTSDCGGESSPPLFDSPTHSETAEKLERTAGVVDDNDEEDELPTRDVPPNEIDVAYQYTSVMRDDERAPAVWRSSAVVQSPSVASITSAGEPNRRLSRQCGQ